jgi:hypothetical protein
MRNEIISNLVHYAVKFSVNLENDLPVEITPRTGSFFQTQSGNPYVTNWRNFGVQTEKNIVTAIYGSLKGPSIREINAETGTSTGPLVSSVERSIGLSYFFKVFLESLFLTFRVNQKEYLEKIPAILLPAPWAMQNSPHGTRVATMGGMSYAASEFDSVGVTGAAKSTSDNGFSLREGIQINRGDTFDVRYQLDGLDRTLNVLNLITQLDKTIQDGAKPFTFWYDLSLAVNTMREVQ